MKKVIIYLLLSSIYTFNFGKIESNTFSPSKSRRNFRVKEKAESYSKTVTGAWVNAEENFRKPDYTRNYKEKTSTIAFNSSSGEGDENTTNIEIGVALNQVSSLDVTVDFSVTSGTADSLDYSLNSSSLTIPSGEINGSISLTVYRDVLTESDEFLTITLANPVNTDLGGITAFNYTIKDVPMGHTGPGGIGDANTLVMWLKPEFLNYNDGDAIGIWTDASGNGNDLIQNDDNFKPTYKDSVLNGFPAVRFDGSDDRLVKDNFIDFPTTSFTLSNTVNFSTGLNHTFYSYEISDYANELELFNEGTFWPIRIYLNNSNSIALPISPQSDFHNLLYGYERIRNILTVSKLSEGILDYQVQSFQNNSDLISGGRFALGARQTTTNENNTETITDSNFYAGDVTESIIYNVYLNETQRYILENYKIAKYKLTRSNIYNNFNIGFGHEVAGIGQISASDNHLDAQGTGIVRINNAQDLDDGEFLLWGHNEYTDLDFTSADVPNGLTERLNIAWLSIEKNYFSTSSADVGGVDISFDLSDVALTVSLADLVLLVDDDGQFASGASMIQGGIDVGNNIIRFENVSALSDGSYFTIGTTVPEIQFSQAEASGSESVTNSSIEVILSESSSNDITVNYTVTGNTATAGVDYTMENGALTIPAGSTSAFISFDISDDTLDELDETFSINLSAATGANIGAINEFTYTILDDPIGYLGPGGIGNSNTLVLWLKPESLMELENGDPVSSWTDASGNENTLTQSITSSQPTLIENSVNGWPSVRFSAANGQYLKTNNGFNNFDSSSFTFFQMSKEDPSNDKDNSSFYALGTDNDIGHYWLNSNLRYKLYGTPIFSFNNNEYTDFVIHEFVWRRRELSLWALINKYGIITNLISQSAFTTPSSGENFVLSAQFNGDDQSFTNYYAGDFSEFIVYNKGINRTQIDILSAYLETKFGLTPFVKIYKHGDDANGNFDFDVAGIGRVNEEDYHLDSQGTGIVRINNPQDLDDQDFLSWGHDGIDLNESSNDVPEGVSIRLKRRWRVSEVVNINSAFYNFASGDVGAIDISFDLTGLGGVDVTDLVLLVDADGVFISGATSITGAEDLGNNIYRFSGVTAISDNDYFTLGTADANETPLPVELISFEGSVSDNANIALQWVTVSEENCSHFVLERSGPDMIYSAITSIMSRGSAEEETEYNFIDLFPLTGRNYYRLKQFDNDGTYHYTPVVSLNFGEQNLESQYAISPNPIAIGETLQLKVNLSEAGPIEVYIVSSAGRQLHRKGYNLSKGASTLNISTLGLTKGLNYLRIIDLKGSTKVFKIIVN
ncbi:Calx-beta domain-containing protein [Roseivirga sp.]|uniref:Calx-beta domain-containing protein n=1 Tax=Roseivirga sp. TaxID=1964215 RepID=UPI003B8E384E